MKDNPAGAKSLSLLLVALLLSGCAPAASSYRDNPAFERRARGVNSIVILPLTVIVYQVDAGGLKEKISQWSREATTTIAAAVRKEFERRSPALRFLAEKDLSEHEKATLDQTRALFEAVETSILLHTYGPPGYRFPEKMLDFEYSLGREVRGLSKGESDALLLIQGIDHQWTEGRKALQAFGVIVGLGAAVATGVLVVPVLGGGTMIRAALVDSRNGTLWWYSIASAQTGHDLRDGESAARLVRELFKDFPVGGKSNIPGGQGP